MHTPSRGQGLMCSLQLYSYEYGLYLLGGLEKLALLVLGRAITCAFLSCLFGLALSETCCPGRTVSALGDVGCC